MKETFEAPMVQVIRIATADDVIQVSKAEWIPVEEGE